MVPTGQTVAAVVLALGLAGGPSAAQPAAPPEQTETSDAPVSDEAASASPDRAEPDADGGAEPETVEEGSEANAEPEPESDADDAAAAVSEPDAEPGQDPAAPDAAAEVDETAVPTPAATEPPPEADEEAWDEESWDEEEAWDDDYDPLRDSPEALSAQRRIAGGAVVLGLGAMVSFGGLAMVLSDPCARPAGNSCSAASRNRAALTMALPGLATVAVGSVMLALGLRQRKALRVDANLNASGAGVSFRGRF